LSFIFIVESDYGKLLWAIVRRKYFGALVHLAGPALAYMNAKILDADCGHI